MSVDLEMRNIICDNKLLPLAQSHGGLMRSNEICNNGLDLLAKVHDYLNTKHSICIKRTNCMLSFG